MSNHHDLISYQKSKQLVKQVVSLGESVPKSRSGNVLYTQLIRSASSIGANIAEGYGRNNPREYRQFLGIARGSALETEYWLEILSDSFRINTSDIIDLNRELIKITTTTIKSLST